MGFGTWIKSFEHICLDTLVVPDTPGAGERLIINFTRKWPIKIQADSDKPNWIWIYAEQLSGLDFLMSMICFCFNETEYSWSWWNEHKYNINWEKIYFTHFLEGKNRKLVWNLSFTTIRISWIEITREMSWNWFIWIPAAWLISNTLLRRDFYARQWNARQYKRKQA